MEKHYYKVELFCSEANLWKDWLHSSSLDEEELKGIRTKCNRLKELYHIESRIMLVHEQLITE